ncbi:MAG: hypothetical protein ABI876_01085, partial [Bacteroidota bacterium]
ALEEQLDCYKRLFKLAELQHEHVQNSRTEQLLEVLGRRQEVLDHVSRLEQTIGPAKRGWGEYLRGLGAPDRTAAEGLLAETRRLLEQITTADRNDALVLQQRKLNLGRQINQASAAKKVNRNIAASAYGGARVSRMDVQQ